MYGIPCIMYSKLDNAKLKAKEGEVFVSNVNLSVIVTFRVVGCKGETKGRGRSIKPQQKSALLPLP